MLEYAGAVSKMQAVRPGTDLIRAYPPGRKSVKPQSGLKSQTFNFDSEGSDAPPEFISSHLVDNAPCLRLVFDYLIRPVEA